MSDNAKQTQEFVHELTSHQAALRAFIVSQLPGLPGAGDVLQEVNLLLWEKKSLFQPGTNFRAWSFTVTRYKIMEHRRALKRNDWLVFDNDVADRLAEDTDEDAQRTELYRQALDFCIAKLSASDRELIQQRYGSGTSLKQYATQIGKEPGSLRITLHRIRAALRDCVNTSIFGGTSQAPS